MQNNIQNNIQNIVFYSQKCNTCQVFIKLCQTNNILKYFKLISIDGQEKTFQAKGLKIVPTLIIKELNKQIEGKQCLEWLDEIIKTKSSKINNNEKIYIPEYNTNTNNQNLVKQNNQFQVSNTNILKRNTLTSITPPQLSANNIKQRIIKQEFKDMQESTNLNNGPTVKSINQTSPSTQLFGFLENEMTGFSDSYAYLLVDNPLPKSFLPPDKDLQIYTAPEGEKLDKKKQDMIMKSIEFARENDKMKFTENIENTLQDKIRNLSK